MGRDFVVLGAAVYDISGIFLRETVNERDSNPSEIYSSCGGVGRNIAENAARLGLSCGFVTVLGTDDFSAALKKSCEDAGVDISRSYSGDNSKPCTYINLLDSKGELVLAASDLTSVEKIPPNFFVSQMEYVNSHKLVCVEANLVESQLFAITENATGIIMGDTVSIAKAPRFRPIIKHLTAIKTNIAELGALTEKAVHSLDDVINAARHLLDVGVKMVFVTMGERGAIYVDCDVCIHADILKTPVISVTGVGDAFGAGIAYGILRGAPPDEMLCLGTAMSQITLKSPSAVSPDISERHVLKVAQSPICRYI